MSNTDQNVSRNVQQESEAPHLTPLEAVRAAQATRQGNHEAAEQRVDATADVPGQGPPSSKRHHPQRQMYGGGGH